MLTLAKRRRTRSPRRMSSGAVPGKARLLKVKMLKSSITFGFGVARARLDPPLVREQAEVAVDAALRRAAGG